MKVKVEITELNFEELVNILSTAFYDNAYMELNYVHDKNSKRHECYEENAAQALLDGRAILVTDWGGSTDFGTRYGHLPAVFDNPDGVWTYQVKLQDFYKGASNPECLRMIEDILTGEGDMITGWNLMQKIIFEEVIYG